MDEGLRSGIVRGQPSGRAHFWVQIGNQKLRLIGASLLLRARSRRHLAGVRPPLPQGDAKPGNGAATAVLLAAQGEAMIWGRRVRPAGKTVLVNGVLGAVGSLAAQLATWRDAPVIGTVRRSSDLSDVDETILHRVALDEADPVAAIRRVAPGGVQRIVEVSFSDNADLDAAVAAPEAVIAAYATRNPRPDFDFWTMLFANLTIRLLGSDDFPLAAKHEAAADLRAAAQERRSSRPDDDPLPLERIAEAHDRVDAGARRRVVLSIPD